MSYIIQCAQVGLIANFGNVFHQTFKNVSFFNILPTFYVFNVLFSFYLNVYYIFTQGKLVEI